MRLFIALNLPEAEKERIHEAVAPLRDANLPVRWVEPVNYHVTLKFLGDIRPDTADEVTEAVDEIASKTEPFAVDVGGFGAFPTIRKPKVIWMGIQATPALRCLKQGRHRPRPHFLPLDAGGRRVRTAVLHWSRDGHPGLYAGPRTGGRALSVRSAGFQSAVEFATPGTTPQEFRPNGSNGSRPGIWRPTVYTRRDVG